MCLLAALAGTALLYKISLPGKVESRKYHVGVAQARILLDTPSSQVVDVAAKGSDSLGVRANLIASLMVGGSVKSAIAERAGLAPEKLIGITELAEEPSPVAEKPKRDDFVLTTNVVTNTGGDQLPIIEVTAQAPSRAAAATLANAAVSGLRDYLDSTASQQHIGDGKRLQVTGLGKPTSTLEVKGPSNMIAIMLVIFLIVLGCAGILVVSAVNRGWRAATAREAEDVADGELLAEPGEEDLDEPSEEPSRPMRVVPPFGVEHAMSGEPGRSAGG